MYVPRDRSYIFRFTILGQQFAEYTSLFHQFSCDRFCYFNKPSARKF